MRPAAEAAHSQDRAHHPHSMPVSSNSDRKPITQMRTIIPVPCVTACCASPYQPAPHTAPCDLMGPCVSFRGGWEAKHSRDHHKIGQVILGPWSDVLESQEAALASGGFSGTERSREGEETACVTLGVSLAERGLAGLARPHRAQWPRMLCMSPLSPTTN